MADLLTARKAQHDPAATKDYRLHARIKNNRLWTALEQRFPGARTQAAMARAVGVTPQELGQLLNMRWWPWDGRAGGRWATSARRIAEAVQQPEEVLFDAELYGTDPGGERGDHDGS